MKNKKGFVPQIMGIPNYQTRRKTIPMSLITLLRNTESPRMTVLNELFNADRHMEEMEKKKDDKDFELVNGLRNSVVELYDVTQREIVDIEFDPDILLKKQ